MLATIFNLFFPKRCVGCKTVGSYLCVHCYTSVKRPHTLVCIVCDRPSIDGSIHPLCQTKYTPDGVTAAYQFASPIKELIHEIKYRGVFDIAFLCANMLSTSLPQAVLDKQPIIMPVPLHKVKQRERGFNQSALVGKKLANIVGLRYIDSVLLRTKQTETQTKLHRHERQQNVANTFSCKQDLRGVHILLIDDTVTTGATLLACSNALKRAGADYVWCMALAQAPLARN